MTEIENRSSSLDEGRLRNFVPMDVNFDLQLEEQIQVRRWKTVQNFERRCANPGRTSGRSRSEETTLACAEGKGKAITPCMNSW